MTDIAFQDIYPDDVSHCYGCGRLNEKGLRIRTFWDGNESVTRFEPRPEHSAMPGFVYGGLIASLIDCHATGTASAAAHRAAGRDPAKGPAPRFVTASLHVDFVRPTPLGPTIEVRGRVKQITSRRVVVVATLSVEGNVCAKAEVTAVRMPEKLRAKK